MDAYIARQPIFDRHKKIFGYELLFRDSLANFAPETDGDVATSTVLSNTFLVIGSDVLLGGHKSFINFTQNMLTKKVPLLLPNDTTVVEVLENIKPTADLIEACRELSQKGYLIALDDFSYDPRWQPLIDLADIILIETYERGQRDQMCRIADILEVPHEKMPELYIQACRWSNNLLEGEGS